MASPELPEVRELFRAIADLRTSAVAFQDVVFRSVAMRYATTTHFLSGVGAAKSGGRWNPKGMEALYASLDQVTATKEAYQNFTHYGWALAKVRPRVIAGVEVQLQAVLDLTVPRHLRKLGFTLRDLTTEDWRSIQASGEESWTQAIGRGSRASGFEAMLVPSARHRQGRNIVIFPDQLQKRSSLKLLGDADLPE